MAKRRRCVFGFCYSLLTILVYARVSFSARSDKEVRERFYGNMMNSSAPVSGDGTIAKMFDRVLEKEFSENDQPEGSDGASFNSSVADQQAVLETVAKITHEKGKKNDTQVGNGTKPYDFEGVFSLENEDSEETTTLIDKKDNVFVMSNKKSKYPVLQVDLRLISDLVVIIVSAAIGGILFSCLGQPVIVGYLLAGSLIGPGGLTIITEMVQVETVAQFGVVFLLFALGLEFSLAKLKAVGPVAVLGGLLQIMTFMLLCAITAVVVKFLAERNSNSALHGQVTIGTLIFQDCAVGLLFALLPVLGGHSGLFQGMVSVGKLLLVLSLYLGAVSCSDKLGLSLELGSFVAGVMISTTDLAQHTLDQVEPIRNLFAALFLSSIGMLIHVHFLWSHVDILLASVILVIVVKTAVATIVTKAFGYSFRTSFVVGVSLAQIGEFAFVLLSRASNLKLVEGKMYLLLLGTTALSLVTTPLLFKLTPAIMNLGVLMHWFPSEGTPYNELSAVQVSAYFLFPPLLQEKASMIDAQHNRILHRDRREWMEGQRAALFQCQRIGCNAMFSEDDNPEGSCQYHDSRGKHTTEKPVLAKPKPKDPVPSPTTAPATDASSKQSCSRCRQGFFCSDHGAQAKEINSKPVNVETTPLPESITDDQGTSAPPKKIVDINQPQTCKNKGCGKTFKEKDNHESACSYHPGPAIFHDRVRGWKCCDVHVKEFDEFMSIPPCTKEFVNEFDRYRINC
ncbi:hypothetical protein DVH24_024627 [Malus domestica]|uniref:CHORD domain-containing protein n=1 Tax=Malus domestica TaxID=3750 RepID=A0A498JM96_MALDO|nr:hypothetical protein DVH24_024627 [Malus domestica]